VKSDNLLAQYVFFHEISAGVEIRKPICRRRDVRYPTRMNA